MRPLSDDEISTALVSLAHWEYQVDSLARLAATDDPKGLESAVNRVVGADGDHVDAVRTPNGLVLRVATPDTGVTSLDVEIAARIDQAIELGGSDARPSPP